MSQAGFETKIPVNERPQTRALNRAATGIGYVLAITGTLTTAQHCKNGTFRSLDLFIQEERRMLFQPASQMKLIFMTKFIK
jgi:hypothetical protein